MSKECCAHHINRNRVVGLLSSLLLRSASRFETPLLRQFPVRGRPLNFQRCRLLHRRRSTLVDPASSISSVCFDVVPGVHISVYHGPYLDHSSDLRGMNNVPALMQPRACKLLHGHQGTGATEPRRCCQCILHIDRSGCNLKLRAHLPRSVWKMVVFSLVLPEDIRREGTPVSIAMWVSGIIW